MNALYEQLGAEKMDWQLILPFLEAARLFCGSEFRETGSVRLHTLRAEGDDWVDAEEAFLGISVADREDGEHGCPRPSGFRHRARRPRPEKVRRIVAALERSIAKLNAWLADRKKKARASPNRVAGPPFICRTSCRRR